MGEFFTKLFDTSDFPARWYCGNWSEFHGWLHIVSDIATWGAYFAIPVVLVYFARKRNDFPFTKLFWLFAAFILACGTVHLVEAIIFWHPIYRISALVKFITAVVSWATVVALIPVIPKVMQLPSLATINTRLAEEIEERKRAEHELRTARDDLQQQKRELELMYEAAPVGMSLNDRDFRYLRINDRLAAINGLPQEEHIGRRIRDVLPELGEQIESFYQRIFASGQPVLDVEITGKTRSDSRERIWSVSYYPLRQNDGSIDAISAIVQDITDRKLQEERLRQSEQAALAANQSKSEFLANMSHEIRTPMAAIIGYADVLLGDLEDPDNRNCVFIMKRNGEHLLDLINDILDLSQIEAGKLEIEAENYPLLQLVEDVQSLMRVRAEEKNLDFQVEFEDKVPELVKTDPRRLRQVLINLIGNAIKFTDKGEVRLVVKLIGDPEFQVIEFAVRDTGIGMDEEQQERLFKPFSQGDSSVTRSYGGSGLGLAISKRLVHMLKGEIEVRSERGRGSTFFVRLPVEPLSGVKLIQPSSVVRSGFVEEAKPKDGKLACRVLVVDDRHDIRHISQHFLEKAGASVSTAEDGRKGIEAALGARDGGEPFDLIIMDMHMPKIDGLHARAELRSAGIEWPIIALTADAMKGDRDRCLHDGCDDYLSKPLDHAQLIAMVRRYTKEITIDDLRTRRIEQGHLRFS